MVICLEQGANLHMAQLMSLPLTVSCFSKIQIGFAFLVPAYPGSPGKRAVKRGVCVLREVLLWLSLIYVLCVQGSYVSPSAAFAGAGLYMYSVDQPPPAHMGIPPFHIDPKTGSSSRAINSFLLEI